jgi:S-sulfo-L-cysteine synthase (3-phospho-L-serine-dependent)
VKPGALYPLAQRAPVFESGAAGASLPLLVAWKGILFVAFQCMKLLPAREILQSAQALGKLRPQAPVVATSSGTFGYGLALNCSRLGHPCTIVSDPAIDPRFASVLSSAGAKVEIVSTPAASGGFQQARLDRVEELLDANPEAFEADQYGDPANPAAYEPVAELIQRSAGPLDILVGAVGSGGSLCGSSRLFRRANPKLLVAAVDTPGSVIFGCADAPRLLRGLGNSILPGNLDHTAIDYVHWVDPSTAFAATRDLFSSHGLFQGPTSGAALAVAEWYHRNNPDARIAVFLPDSGLRYIDTVFNQDWVQKNAPSPPASRPTPVASPLHVAPDCWSVMPWGRQTLGAVLASHGAAA